MIYLDVTSACQSPLNTGVKRMQRGWHGHLQGRANYTPVCWQSARRGYRMLTTKDVNHLEQTGPQQVKRFGLFDSLVPGLLSNWLHFANDAPHMLDWPTHLIREDILLLPDLLWDNRATFIARLGSTAARRVAVFHDAIALRRPKEAGLDRYFCAKGVRALAQMDAVICISQEAEHDLHFYWKKFGLKPVPTQVILWPVPFRGQPPVSQTNFAAKHLLYIARLEPHKNHLRLLDACEKLWIEDLFFELRLIGCLAYPGTARLILSRVRALQAKGRPVRWQAHVSENELHEAYAESSFTVFPSLLEGFGLPIIESLWHGRPVVCGANGALGEVIAGGGCEAVDTHSVESLADGMRLLLTNEPCYQQLCAEIQARPIRTWDDYWKDVSDWLGLSSRA